MADRRRARGRVTRGADVDESGAEYCRAVTSDDHVAAARAVYDASVERYVEFVGTEISTRRPRRRSTVHCSVHSSTSSRSRDVRRVADVGCGTGRATAFLAKNGLDVIGLDVSRRCSPPPGRPSGHQIRRRATALTSLEDAPSPASCVVLDHLHPA